MNEININMNKPLYLGLPILRINEIALYESPCQTKVWRKNKTMPHRHQQLHGSCEIRKRQ